MFFRFYNDVEYDNFSFRGWKPAVSWCIRENLELLIQQPVKFYLNDPGLPLNNCTREGNPNFIKDLCKIDHTFAVVTSEVMPLERAFAPFYATKLRTFTQTDITD